MPRDAKSHKGEIMQVKGSPSNSGMSKMGIKGGDMPMGSSRQGSSQGSNAKVKYAKKQNSHAEAVSKPPEGNGKTMNKNLAGSNEFSTRAKNFPASEKAKNKGKAMQSRGADNPRAKPMTKMAKKEKNFSTDSYF